MKSTRPACLLALVWGLMACGSEAPPKAEDAGPRRMDTGLGCSLVVPADWTMKETGSKNRHFLSPLTSTDDDFRENLGVVLVDRDELVDASALRVAARGGLDLGGLKEIGEGELTVGGLKTYKLLVHRDSLKRTYIQYYLTVKRGQAYRITGTTNDQTKEQYLPVFEEMVESLQFE